MSSYAIPRSPGLWEERNIGRPSEASQKTYLRYQSPHISHLALLVSSSLLSHLWCLRLVLLPSRIRRVHYVVLGSLVRCVVHVVSVIHTAPRFRECRLHRVAYVAHGISVSRAFLPSRVVYVATASRVLRMSSWSCTSHFGLKHSTSFPCAVPPSCFHIASFSVSPSTSTLPVFVALSKASFVPVYQSPRQALNEEAHFTALAELAVYLYHRSWAHPLGHVY